MVKNKEREYIMTAIETFINKMKQKYGDEVVVKERTDNKEIPLNVPEPLKEFYLKYEYIEFTFGSIDSVENALRHSAAAEPFKSQGWFCFGFDGYFSYWLCRYEPDKDGLWLASWDHEVDDEIECIYADLVSFLQALEEEYEENCEEYED